MVARRNNDSVARPARPPDLRSAPGFAYPCRTRHRTVRPVGLPGIAHQPARLAGVSAPRRTKRFPSGVVRSHPLGEHKQHTPEQQGNIHPHRTTGPNTKITTPRRTPSAQNHIAPLAFTLRQTNVDRNVSHDQRPGTAPHSEAATSMNGAAGPSRRTQRNSAT